VRGVPANPGPHRRFRALTGDGAADLGRPTTLLLVRHGRTDATDQRRVSGGTGVPRGSGGADRPGAGPGLNAAGRLEVQRLAEWLARRFAGRPGDPDRPAAVVASPLLRARQTALRLGEALGVEPGWDDDWAEVSLGDWDGLSYAEIAEGWPVEYHAWRTSTAAAPPHGEALDDVLHRVQRARRRLIEQWAGGTVLVVSHTAPIRTVITQALDAGPIALWRLRVDPASVTTIRFWADGGCEVSGVNSVAQPG
jgi:broad specificity phosphatase PhoE